MTPLAALLLGIVEGITEYLPISSTGHLIVASQLLHEKSASFDIVIQAGAVHAVVVQYRALLAERARGLLSRKPESVRLLLALAAAFAPTAVAGLLLRKIIREYLFGAGTVADALMIGGVVMIGVERLRARSGVTGETGLERVTPMRGFLIGLGQCVSLVPGSSRSMCTIVAGELAGLSTATAAEFSFLLALPTLLAATAYEGWKGRHELGSLGVANVGIGLVVSFVVAWAVIAGFIRYLQRRGLEPFGWYRIVAGAAVLALWLGNYLTPKLELGIVARFVGGH
jgi:undecaprenyl-diphosphatase